MKAILLTKAGGGTSLYLRVISLGIGPNRDRFTRILVPRRTCPSTRYVFKESGSFSQVESKLSEHDIDVVFQDLVNRVR